MAKNPKKLKIAILAPEFLPVPPFEGYGGVQRGIYDFAKHLGKKGHKIYLFAPGGSDISDLENTKLYSVIDALWSSERVYPSKEEERLKNIILKNLLD